MSLTCTCLAHRLRIAGGCGCGVPEGFVGVKEEPSDSFAEEEEKEVKTGGSAKKKGLGRKAKPKTKKK
jgi:hypothetical protein